MKFISFLNEHGEERAGWILNPIQVADMQVATGGRLPDNMLAFLDENEKFIEIIRSLELSGLKEEGILPIEKVTLLAPVPQPRSFRDFYAFEQHVKTARSNRGLDMVPEWYDIPVFYFSNHLAFKGPFEEIRKPERCECLDYELEIACVIGKKGRDISVEEAESYIFGYCILNDWSARDFQRHEMKVGLGPAKGKDFATSIGPYILTKDELENFREGKGFNLKMTARVNGVLLSEGNMRDLHYSFTEMIQRASSGVTLYPGEIIGSGTVGTGCILELGEKVHGWLMPEDEVELKIEKLGSLKNTIK